MEIKWIIKIVFLVCLFGCEKSDGNSGVLPEIQVDDYAEPVYDYEEPVYVEPVYDTIYPGSYLPAFPGSYWNYINWNGVETQITTEPEYELHSYSTQPIPNANQSEPVWVPRYDGKALYGYQYYAGFGLYGSGPFKGIVHESLGASWYVIVASASAQSNEKERVTAVDTTIVVNGVSYFPTIQVKRYPTAFPELQMAWSYRYFCKNIGMIKGDGLEIVDYYINY